MITVNFHFANGRESIEGVELEVAPGWVEGQYIGLGTDDGMLIDSISYRVEMPSGVDPLGYVTQNVMLVDGPDAVEVFGADDIEAESSK
jgi:hypothetical protein